MKAYDLVSLGEALLRFSPPRGERMEQAARFDVRLAGSQFNVAADAARLGLRSAFLTQLPESPLGGFARNVLTQYGVDQKWIRSVPGSRIGSTYVEFSLPPRPARAIYDRKASAASAVDEASFPWDEIAAQSAMCYTDGIFPALGAGCERAALAWFSAGRRQGAKNCFDLNFRRHLWSEAEAAACWRKLLPLVDVAVINRAVCEKVFGYSGDDRRLIERFAAEFGVGCVAFTARRGEGERHGAWRAVLRTEDGAFFESEIEFDIVDRYGTGDAWFTGLLTGLLRYPPERALAFADAVIALAHTTFGDAIQTTAAEAEALAFGKTSMLQR